MSREKKVGICIFMIALAFGLNITGIVPVLGMISEQTGWSTSTVQMMQTLHYVLLMVSSLMAGWLTERLTKKKIAILACAVIGVSGVLPFFSSSFGMLVISRFLIGFGFGICGPIITAIITEFFPPEERTVYMGLNVVGMGIGAMLGNIIGGMLAKISLNFFYLVYLMAFVSIAVIQALLPETPVQKDVPKSAHSLNAMVYIISGIAFLHTLFITVFNTNISMYIAQTITSDPGAAGIVTAVSSGSSLLMGLTFNRMAGYLKRATLPFSIFAAALGFAVVLLIPGMAGSVIASFLCGISLSCFSAMGGFLMSVVVQPEAVPRASGMFSIIGGIGGLISPIVMNAASGRMNGGNIPQNQFVIAAAGMVVVGILMLLILKYRIGELDE